MNNIYYLTIPNIFKQIIAKYSLPYDILKLNKSQIDDLTIRANKVIFKVIELLPDDISILAKSYDTLIWTQKFHAPLYLNYEYVYEYYAKGLVSSTQRYVFWNGQCIVYKGYLDDAHTAGVCKLLFYSKLLEILSGRYNVDISQLRIEDYIFNTFSGQKILDKSGMFIPLGTNTIDDIPINQYVYWVQKKLKVLAGIDCKITI